MKYLGAPQSGSQNATTAGRNRYGQYYRTRAIPVNPRTSVQQAHRSLFAGVSASWRALSAADQAAWTAFAASVPFFDSLGQPLTLSGQAAYNRCNIVLASAGQAQITVPGMVPVLVNAVITSTLVSATGVFTSTFAPTPVPADQVYQVQATASKSFGVAFFGNSDFRNMTFGYLQAADASPKPVDYVGTWGTPGPVGTIICVRWRVIDSLSGLTSPWAYERVELS